MRVLIVFNPVSGSGRAARLAETLNERLCGESIDGQPIEVTRLPTELAPPETWLQGPLAQTDLLIVVGGDGAMRLAAESAILTQVAVFHYPAGTENLFSREFAMRADPECVLAAMRAGIVTQIDVARIEGELLLLCASSGMDGAIIEDLARHRHGAISHLSYFMPIFRQAVWWQYKRPRFSITVDGVALGEPASGFAVVANARQYATRLDPVACAVVDDGQLDVVLYPARTLFGFALWLLRCWRRTAVGSTSARYARGRQITVRTEPPAPLQVDGEAVACSIPGLFSVNIEKGALRVLLPPADVQ